MKTTKPRVPQPCHASWDAMAPNQGGRFCGACQKTVIDFTAMTDQEILSHLASSRASVCGRFRNEQLEVAPKTWRDTLFQIQTRARSIRMKPIRWVTVVLVSMVLIITGCQSPSGEKEGTTGDIAVDTLPKIDSTIKIDSIPERGGRTTGVIAMPVDHYDMKQDK